MKTIKYTTLAAILLLITSSAKAQEYFPFPTDTAQWNIYSRWSPFGDFDEDTFICFLNGDTTLLGKNYSKVYSVLTLYGDIDTSYAGYIGGLREDTNKNIYFKSKNGHIPSNNCFNLFMELDTTEILLYSFDVEVGDSIFAGIDTTDPLIVSEIDSILVNSEYRKRYQVGSSNIWDTWIEGIGSVNSLFGSICINFEGIDVLLCYEDSKLFFKGPENPYNGCSHITPANIKEYRKEHFTLYPNPASKELYVIGEKRKANRINLYNSAGILLHTSTEINASIDVSYLNAGLYIVEIISGDMQIHKKLLILRE